MDKIKIVKKAFNFDTPPEIGKEYFSDNFQATDSVGSPPMDKETWFGMGELMKASMPDVDYVMDDIRQEGEDVILVGRFTGTFMNDFDLSAINMGVIPATGKPVNFPTSTERISFEGDKIIKSHNLDTGPDAGISGLMKAMGVG